MNDQKIENQLNLALEATEEEREKSVVLNTGYDREERTWELIVKYTGDLERIASENIQVTRLLNEYAILVVPESLIGWRIFRRSNISRSRSAFILQEQTESGPPA